ncbi:MAG: hypothetical protein LBJ12_06630 [Oscillospiraceae bacterium]|jgi:hypothetical protein|nr:hypothetical protein [Oscillospiraceae bacterium]
MNTLNFIAHLVTLPGAYIHTFWERIFANMLNITVTDAHFLTKDANAGHIRHNKADVGKLILYSLLTEVVCLITGVPLFAFGYAMLGHFGVVPREGGLLLFIPAVIALYIGTSLLANLYPSRQDARAIWRGVAQSKSAAVKLFGYPLAAVLNFGAFCESIGLATLGLLGYLAVYFLIYVFEKV